MLKELLKEDRVVLDLTGDFDEAIEKLLEKLTCPERMQEIKQIFSGKNLTQFSYIHGQTAIPHLRLENLSEVQVILGLSPEGIVHDDNRLRVILILITPDEDPVTHLKLLQGLSSVVPAISDEILGMNNPEAILKAIARNEEKTDYASFINLTQNQIAFELQTNPSAGLSDAEAKKRLRHYGPNILKKSARIPWYIRIIKDFFSFFAVLLWIAAILCYIPGVDMPRLGDAIFIVIFLNGIFSFLQEYKSDSAVEALQKLIAQSCRVFRDGKISVIPASQLVVGDIIALEEGDIVPADSRLIEASEIEVDNSALTGESNSVRRYKTDQPIVIEGKFLWNEMPNIVFSGSALIRGNGKAVVFGTGMQSEIGKIARLTQDIKHEKSPLQKQLQITVFAIGTLALSLGLAFLFLGWLVAGLSFVQAFIFFIGIFVANVPEGLLPTVSLSLAMGVSRMAKRNAIVKDLSSVETLGCTTVICSDKTGTLTQNLMMVTQIYTDEVIMDVRGKGYEPEGEFYQNGVSVTKEKIFSNHAFKYLIECALVCNNARIDKINSGFRILGDPTEGALVALAARAGYRGTHQRIHQNPFESVRKCMSVVVRVKGQSIKLLYAKGAPLEILKRCTKIYSGENIRELTPEDIATIKTRIDEMARRGLRILALAFRNDEDLQKSTEYGIEKSERDLVFLGLTAMSDPVRPGVPEAVHSCHQAGIRILMITGDYPLTAESIGREIGLGENGGLQVFSGTETAMMRDDALKNILKKGETIFARVSPEQKLRIVTLLKEMNEVVAVTGDGVNDGPALKKADIGIAMGLRGTEVAKEASRIILADDNFNSIVAAIEEGRAVFENIKRFSAYVFSSNPQEIYPYILWMLFPGFPLSMTVMGVLAVDVGTDLVPAMGLGIEPPESGIMEKPPRKKEEKLLSIGFILKNYFVQGSILSIASYLTYLYFAYTSGLFDEGFSFLRLPASPQDINMAAASMLYLQSLTAYFFPTVTTQIANVMCRRSWNYSLFSRNFLNESYRNLILERIRSWHPSRYTVSVHLNKEITSLNQLDALRLPFILMVNLFAIPFRYMILFFMSLALVFEKPVVRPFLERLSAFLEKNYIVLNIFSNPLINAGIVFELLFCYIIFYTPLSEVYYFAPIPWHVYLFAFHGTILFFAFEEIKKYFRRKGRSVSDLS